MKKHRVSNTKIKLPSKIKIIGTLAVLASIIAIVVLVIAMIGVKTDRIIIQYNNLSSKPADSSSQFGKHVIYITRNNDGSLSISYGLPGSYATDSNVTGVNEIPDDLDGDGLSDDVDPDPLVPNECTCTTKCDASHQDSTCEYCAVDWTKCKAGTNTEIEFDGDIYKALKASGFSEDKAKAGAVIYATIEPVYGHKAALALMACSFCEGKAGQFEMLTGYMTGKNSTSGLDKSYAGLRNMYLLASKTSEQQECLNIFTNLGGKIISSSEQARQWQKACDTLEKFCGSSGGQGIGFIQFSGGRRTPRLQAYMSSSDFSENGRWSSEMNACLNEVAGNATYKSAFTSASSASDSTSAVTTMFTTYISGGSKRGLSTRISMMNDICKAIPFNGG